MKINCNFKGENNGNARLNWENVNRMRKMWATQKKSFGELGLEFRISRAHARRIVLNMSWNENTPA